MAPVLRVMRPGLGYSPDFRYRGLLGHPYSRGCIRAPLVAQDIRGMTMDNQIRRIFVSEIKSQCTFAVIAAKDFNAALQQGDHDRIWYSVHAFLSATANVSKILWPKEIHKDRGDELRQLLSVPDDSVLKPRKFRNHFEHFDERLERWATSSERRNFVDRGIMHKNAIVGIDPSDYLRNLDTEDMAITFRGIRTLSKLS